MKKTKIIINLKKKNSRETLGAAKKLLGEHGFKISSDPDFIVAMGGDGTILAAAGVYGRNYLPFREPPMPKRASDRRPTPAQAPLLPLRSISLWFRELVLGHSQGQGHFPQLLLNFAGVFGAHAEHVLLHLV